MKYQTTLESSCVFKATLCQSQGPMVASGKLFQILQIQKIWRIFLLQSQAQYSKLPVISRQKLSVKKIEPKIQGVKSVTLTQYLLVIQNLLVVQVQHPPLNLQLPPPPPHSEVLTSIDHVQVLVLTLLKLTVNYPTLIYVFHSHAFFFVYDVLLTSCEKHNITTEIIIIYITGSRFPLITWYWCACT